MNIKVSLIGLAREIVLVTREERYHWMVLVFPICGNGPYHPLFWGDESHSPPLSMSLPFPFLISNQTALKIQSGLEKIKHKTSEYNV